MVMEKEAGVPSMPGPARLWVELQATVNEVSVNVRCVSPSAIPTETQTADSHMLPVHLAARWEHYMYTDCPSAIAAPGPHRGTVWGG